MAWGGFGRPCISPLHTMQVSLRDRGEPCWLPCGLRSGKMTLVRAGVRDFKDKTGAIFPACFLAGWAGEPVRSKKNVTWFSRAGIAKDRWLKYDIKFYTHRRGLSKEILLIYRRFVSVKNNINFHKRLNNFIFVIDYDIQLNLNDFITT